MKSEEAKRLTHMVNENRRLKQLVADQALDIQMLKHLSEVKRMLQLPRAKPRYGYRRIGWLLRKEGWRAGAISSVSSMAAGGSESACTEAEKASAGLERQLLYAL